jgi:hypothetical protein
MDSFANYTTQWAKREIYRENISTPSECDKSARSLMLIQLKIKCDLMGQWAIAQRRFSKI